MIEQKLLTPNSLKMSIKSQIIISVSILGALALSLWFSNYYIGTLPESIRILLWSLSLLFIPWYRTTKALFQNEELDALEIIALSFAFSISVTPLLVFYLNLAGLPITQWLVYGVCVWISIWWMIRSWIRNRHNEAKK